MIVSRSIHVAANGIISFFFYETCHKLMFNIDINKHSSKSAPLSVTQLAPRNLISLTEHWVSGCCMLVFLAFAWGMQQWIRGCLASLDKQGTHLCNVHFTLWQVIEDGLILKQCLICSCEGHQFLRQKSWPSKAGSWLQGDVLGYHLIILLLSEAIL